MSEHHRPKVVVHEWHIVFGGFLQGLHDPSCNGTLTLWGKLHNELAGPDCCVEWHPWSADVDALAEKIFNFHNGRPPLICVYGYSWGGTTAMRFARCLRRRGLRIRCMVLTDAVYRHWYTLGQWRALVPCSYLLVPNNVDRVDWFYQRGPRFSLSRFRTEGGTFVEPAGHKVRAEDPEATFVFPGQELGFDHSHMDNAPQFHNCAINHARRYHDEP